MTTAKNPHARRQVPRPREFFDLIQLQKPVGSPTERRLRRATDIRDLRSLARRSTPRAVFDFVEGSADAEIGIAAARETFSSVRFRPRVLRDASLIDTATTILGSESRLPFVFAPTGYTRMMHHEGEVAVGRAAAELGIPYCLSTVGTTSPETLKETTAGADLWFQLYLWSDRDASKRLLQRVLDAGYTTLILTVDTVVGGNRRRDIANGLTIPPALTLSTLGGMAIHPSWWLNKLTTPTMKFESFPSDWAMNDRASHGKMFDASPDYDALRWVREQWPGKLAVKGVQTVADAKLIAASGADAIILSNHSGRQMDQGEPVLRILPKVVEEVGPDIPVLLDSGVLRGNDILAALCLGASGVLVGRAYLYGLMAGGGRGVLRAGRILENEIRTSMALIGARSIAELTPDLVTASWLK